MSDLENLKSLNETGFWGKEGAGAILYSLSKNKFGLGLRSAKVLEPGTLGSFGGAIDGSDSIEETIENELMEEIGYFYPSTLRSLKIFEQDGFKYHNFIAIIDDSHFDPVLNWENDSIEWLSLEELQSMKPETLHFGINFILEDAGSVELMKKIETASSREHGLTDDHDLNHSP